MESRNIKDPGWFLLSANDLFPKQTNQKTEAGKQHRERVYFFLLCQPKGVEQTKTENNSRVLSE